MGTQEPLEADGEPPKVDNPGGMSPKPGEPTARFEDHIKEKPQRYSSGRGHATPTRPLDPIQPYMPPRVSRRRRSDWPVLVFALIVAGLVMAGCCVAGFALYSGYGSPFAP